jgi:Tfp pilus assembly protein PilZ
VRIVKLRYKTPQDFSQHYLAEGPAGTLFCPTTTPLEVGEEVVVELAAPALPNKVLLKGQVRWWRPALPRLRVRAGAQVKFLASERSKRDFLLECFASGAGAIPVEGAPVRKRRHVRLPVDIPVRYRIDGSSDVLESGISEISAGGALLRTDQGPLPLDTPVILELRIPGGDTEVEVSGKVTYHSPPDGSGIKFTYRDGGGSRRLRELVRRLRRH